jgi:hypothetical protein
MLKEELGELSVGESISGSCANVHVRGLRFGLSTFGAALLYSKSPPRYIQLTAA